VGLLPMARSFHSCFDDVDFDATSQRKFNSLAFSIFPRRLIISIDGHIKRRNIPLEVRTWTKKINKVTTILRCRIRSIDATMGSERLLVRNFVDWYKLA
jgi:hypothetical protein